MTRYGQLDIPGRDPSGSMIGQDYRRASDP